MEVDVAVLDSLSLISLMVSVDVKQQRSEKLCCLLADHAESCRYNHTLPTCTLYITASKRRAVPTASTTDCSLKCDSTLVGDLPCWGFTMTSSGCVLHYQASQPNCEAVHHRSSAVVRTCFQSESALGHFPPF